MRKPPLFAADVNLVTRDSQAARQQRRQVAGEETGLLERLTFHFSLPLSASIASRCQSDRQHKWCCPDRPDAGIILTDTVAHRGAPRLARRKLIFNFRQRRHGNHVFFAVKQRATTQQGSGNQSDQECFTQLHGNSLSWTSYSISCAAEPAAPEKRWTQCLCCFARALASPSGQQHIAAHILHHRRPAFAFTPSSVFSASSSFSPAAGRAPDADRSSPGCVRSGLRQRQLLFRLGEIILFDKVLGQLQRGQYAVAAAVSPTNFSAAATSSGLPAADRWLPDRIATQPSCWSFHGSASNASQPWHHSEHHAYRQRFAVLGKEPTQCVDLFVFSGIDFHGVLLLNLTSKPNAQRFCASVSCSPLRRSFTTTSLPPLLLSPVISAMRAPHLSARVICF